MSSTTIERIISIFKMAVDIGLVWGIIYYGLKIVRNNSRTIQLFKGIIFIFIIKFFADFFGLATVSWLTENVVNWGFLAIIIVFQPEIRGLLEKLGKSSVFSKITTLSGNEREKLVDELVKATMILSKDQTGALICLEHGQSMTDYIKTGTPMNSVVTAELLTAIFVTSTPLHDGAVIIQGDRIACASAYFPPTSLELPSRYGARHRAAIGISEITDSITVVVSEETGQISIAEAGKLMPVDTRQLREFLLKVICNEEIEVKGKSSRKKATEEKIVIENEKQEPVKRTRKKSTKKTEKVEEVKETVAVKDDSVAELTPEQLEQKKLDAVEEVKKIAESAEMKNSVELAASQEAEEVDQSAVFSIFKKKEDAKVESSDDILSKLETTATKDIKLPKNKKKSATHIAAFESLPKSAIEKEYESKPMSKEELSRTMEIKALKEHINTTKLEENKMKVTPNTDISSNEFSVQFLNDLQEGKNLEVPSNNESKGDDK